MADFLFQFWVVFVFVFLAAATLGTGLADDTTVLRDKQGGCMDEYSLYHMVDDCCLSEFRDLVVEQMNQIEHRLREFIA